LGEWNDSSGSKATQKKIYIAKGQHYYAKTNVAEFKVEAQSVKVGDSLLITGPTTGVIQMEMPKFMVNDVFVDEAKRGDVITFKLDERIRSTDKLYKLVSND
jgi:U32 family peptidase